MDRMNLTPQQLSERLQISRATLANWRSKGYGPRYMKFGKRVLYPMKEVEKFEAANLRSAVHVQG